jgi:uncharacterized membrane protein SpoIIM required for sporulation
MSAPAPPDFRQRLAIETPEHVSLEYELAGIGSRALAAAADTLLITVLLVTVAVLAREAFASLGVLGAIVGTVLGFLLFWGYFTLFEAFRGGQTPGKRWLGIRVVSDTGHALTFGAAAVRNLLRAADLFPPPYLIGGILVAVHPRAKRLGDIVAGTVVIRDRPVESFAERASPEPDEARLIGAPELRDEEFRVLAGYIERGPSLLPEARARFAARLTARFAESRPVRAADPEAFLRDLYDDELERRRGRLAARHGGGKRSAAVERFVAQKGPRWHQFDLLARRVADKGLDSLAAPELPDFATRYREVAADLARARTYEASAAVRLRLERLVAAGHSALYRSERTTMRKVIAFFRDESPAAVVAERATVLLAALVFCAPAAGGYLLLRERPDLGESLLPETMLERAEAGAARTGTGRGYVVASARERPLVAAHIITNNLSVAFNCFAGGALAGVGAFVLLAYNGLAIGAVTGHFANLGMIGYLWSFVIGHGVLELTAIWIAGAAGFLVGHALIAPGELTRADALVLKGRIAMRMLGAVIVMLVLAGLIEGLLSARGNAWSSQLAVSGASLLVLMGYLWHGARVRTRVR